MNLRCSSSSLLISKVSLGLSLLVPLLAWNGAFAGGSYNGPVLSGPSVPVETERFPTFSELQSSVAFCLADMGENLWQQAYRFRPDSSVKREIEFSYLPKRCAYHL